MQIANGLDEFFSILKANGDIHMFIDEDGDPTTEYPHVHVVHKGNGEVEVIASPAQGEHAWRTTLYNPDGNEVNEAIDEAATYL